MDAGMFAIVCDEVARRVEAGYGDAKEIIQSASMQQFIGALYQQKAENMWKAHLQRLSPQWGATPLLR